MRTLFHTCRAVGGTAPALRGGALFALLAAVLGSGCGMRTSIQAEADAVEDEPLADGGALQPCGFGPPCDPSNVGTRTCESLGLGAGVLSCNPVTCNLDLSRCGGGPLLDGGQPPTGTGSPGTPGLFGSAAGSTAPGLFGTGGQGGLFGAGDAGFFGAGNTDGGFFGAGTFGSGNTDEDGGTDDPGMGFFGGNFFGGGAN